MHWAMHLSECLPRQSVARGNILRGHRHSHGERKHAAWLADYHDLPDMHIASWNQPLRSTPAVIMAAATTLVHSDTTSKFVSRTPAVFAEHVPSARERLEAPPPSHSTPWGIGFGMSSLQGRVLLQLSPSRVGKCEGAVCLCKTQPKTILIKGAHMIQSSKPVV